VSFVVPPDRRQKEIGIFGFEGYCKIKKLGIYVGGREERARV